MFKSSKTHLEKSNETYTSHLLWAILAGFKLIWSGIASIVHGIVPGIFTGTAAKTVIDLYHQRLVDHPNKEYQDYIKQKSYSKH
jgi:hypothetical protein